MTKKVMYKAVLVPPAKGQIGASDARLTPAFRNLLSQLAACHLQEVSEATSRARKVRLPGGDESVDDELFQLREEIATLKSSLLTAEMYRSDTAFSHPQSPEDAPPTLQADTHNSAAAVIPSTRRATIEDDCQSEEEEELKPPAPLQQQQQPSKDSTAMEIKRKPQPQGFRAKVAAMLTSDRFEFMLGALIILNVLFMSLQFQYDGIGVGNLLGYSGFRRSSEEEWPGAGLTLRIIDDCFTGLFTVDVGVKILFLGLSFWLQPLNILDFVVVLMSLVFMAIQDLSVNPSFLRMLRLAKLVRGLRALKNSPAVHSLQLLMKCLASSLITLFWSLCVLVIIQMLAAMVIGNTLIEFLTDESVDKVVRQDLFRYYGTFTKTMLTMFEILFANWVPSCRILVDHVSEWWALAFILYRCLIGFAVLNVVSAVFVQSTIKVAQQDNELLIAQKQRQTEAMQKNLRMLFKEIDTSGDGDLSKEEFLEATEDERMKTWLSALEIDFGDLEVLFGLLDDGDGNISIEEFLGGIGKVKGFAKAIDMAQVLAMTGRIEKKLDGPQRQSKKSRRSAKRGSSAAPAIESEQGPGQLRQLQDSQLPGSVDMM